MAFSSLEDYLRGWAAEHGQLDDPPEDETPPPTCSRCHVTGRNLNDDGLCEVCARTLKRGYEISQLTGRCANGAERDHGRLYHARLLRDDGYPQEKAVCGAKPGKRSVGWSYRTGTRVTCKRCLTRLNRMQEAS